VNNQEPRALQRLHVQKIAEIVRDYAVVGFVRCENVVETHASRIGRDGAHRVIPARNCAAGHANDDIHLAIERTELIHPRFVAIENKQTTVCGNTVACGHGFPFERKHLLASEGMCGLRDGKRGEGNPIRQEL
jgi:hypothetical protein